MCHTVPIIITQLQSHIAPTSSAAICPMHDICVILCFLLPFPFPHRFLCSPLAEKQGPTQNLRGPLREQCSLPFAQRIPVAPFQGLGVHTYECMQVWVFCVHYGAQHVHHAPPKKGNHTIRICKNTLCICSLVIKPSCVWERRRGIILLIAFCVSMHQHRALVPMDQHRALLPMDQHRELVTPTQHLVQSIMTQLFQKPLDVGAW